MWNSRKLLKINIKSKNTKLVIPVPLIVFYELLECTEDLLSLLSFILPNIKITIKNKQYKLRNVLKMVIQILEMLREIKYCKPFDLVDIKSGDDIVKISIK